jgi:hypothetical protein
MSVLAQPAMTKSITGGLSSGHLYLLVLDGQGQGQGPGEKVAIVSLCPHKAFPPHTWGGEVDGARELSGVSEKGISSIHPHGHI